MECGLSLCWPGLHWGTRGTKTAAVAALVGHRQSLHSTLRAALLVQKWDYKVFLRWGRFHHALRSSTNWISKQLVLLPFFPVEGNLYSLWWQICILQISVGVAQLAIKKICKHSLRTNYPVWKVELQASTLPSMFCCFSEWAMKRLLFNASFNLTKYRCV